MKAKITLTIIVVGLTLLLAATASATNGDNLIGVGPISRAMGGVGIASPQDAISAVFSNPAAMCFGPYCPASQFDFAGTLFMPHVEARISRANGEVTAESDEKVYAIPAIGFSIPMGDGSDWRFGLSAYGVTGLGVDYRGTAIDNPQGFDFSGKGQGPFAPLVAGEFTSLQIMKFAPAVGYALSSNLSLGIALHIDYSSLDLRNGSSFGYGFGIQPGLIYKPVDNLSLGLTYSTPQSVDHENVNDFDQDGTLDDLELEAPQQFGAGIAYEFSKVLVETNLKWINWSGAAGYEDFDWDDQWVFSIGAQVEAVDNLFLRAGYNYGENPVKTHDGFDGSFNPATGRPNDAVDVQGATIPRYYYETFRMIGFPAVVEHHLTLGAGYHFTDRLSIHAGYVRAFEKSVSETGTDLYGMPVEIESTLSEDSIEFGLSYRF